MALTTTEKIFVLNVYNTISEDFSITRVNIWPGVKKFIDEIPIIPDTNILEVGCGSGQNMEYAIKIGIKTTGIDFSPKMVELCTKKRLNVSKANVIDIPYKDCAFSHVMAVAIIHHLDSHQRRMKAIHECIRVTKKGGTILITLWKIKDQYQTFKDIYIPWKSPKFVGAGIIRYYYLCDEWDVLAIKESIEYHGHTMEISEEYENYYLVIKKNN